jgi:type I thyroxine 5'-deiodinase
LQAAYEKFKDRADFWWIYIREAHAADSKWPAQHVTINQPKTDEERHEVAASCSTALDLKIPLLVDDMADTVNKAYSAWPDRLFILGADGRVAYAGGTGPRWFRVAEMVAELEKLVK